MLSKESISNAVEKFLDSLEISYETTKSKNACFIEFNESQGKNVPGYGVRITMHALDFLGIGVIDMEMVYPIKIKKQGQPAMLEFASHMNQAIPVGYFHFSLVSNEFMYKNFLQFADSEPSHDQLSHFWRVSYGMVSMCTARFLDVALGGVDPKSAADLSKEYK
jgi:hypothetical protein